MSTEFIVVLVPTLQQAQEINRDAEKRTTPHFKLQAIAAGQSVCGLRHGATRPTVIVDQIFDLPKGMTYEYFNKWFFNCIVPMGARGSQWL